jgi:hypothetical protein
MITQQVIRDFLVATFNVPQDMVIPKQGNWFNPQDSESLKVRTFVAFLLGEGVPVATAYWQPGDAPSAGLGSEISTSLVISKVDLQIVGPSAEILANSIMHWLNRQDVIDYLDSHNAQLLAADLGRVIPSTFIQDGDNSVIAYNSVFRLQWANMFEVGETQAITATITGDLTIGA